MRIAFGTDEQTPLADAIRVRTSREEVTRSSRSPRAKLGRRSGAPLASRLRSDVSELGVVCCYTGTGVAMAANKVKGVRAALCTDASTASGARKWNDANVLAIGLRLSSQIVAQEMLDAFIATGADETERAAIGRVEPLEL